MFCTGDTMGGTRVALQIPKLFKDLSAKELSNLADDHRIRYSFWTLKATQFLEDGCAEESRKAGLKALLHYSTHEVVSRWARSKGSVVW